MRKVGLSAVFYLLGIGFLFSDCSNEVEVEGITVSPTTISLQQGKVISLVVKITPPTATNKSVMWTTSDASIAEVVFPSVDEEIGVGKCEVKGVSVGTCVVKAFSPEQHKQAICTVTIVDR